MHAYDLFTRRECGQSVVLPDFEPGEGFYCRGIGSKLSDLQSTGCITTNEVMEFSLELKIPMKLNIGIFRRLSENCNVKTVVL